MASVKSYVRPTRLYRYRSLVDLDREMQAIEGAYLYCAKFGDLNDPMEGFYSSSPSLRRSEHYARIKAAINDTKAQLGVCSFSEVYDHELMWAHYANQFKGICIAYNLSKLLSSLGERSEFVRMYYNERVPIMHKADHGTQELAKRALSSKSYRWLYEREWRLFADQGRANYRDPKCVKCVYLGSRIADEDHDQIVRRMGRLGIETRAMSIKRYSIQFEIET